MAEAGTRGGSPASPLDEWFERANRMAIAARLAGASVHEASNALQAISGTAELLSVDGRSTGVARPAETIAHQVVRATAALQELTSFVREAPDGRQALGLQETAQRALELRRDAFRRLGARTMVSGTAVRCVASPRRLTQAVLNLVINAERALEGVAAAALTLDTSVRGDMAFLEVRDNGAGLPPDLAVRLSTWPPPLDPGRPSLGIGLRVTREIVARDAGTLHWTNGDGGRGAVFVLALPVAAP
jgi:two-component system C4-dicarboxylate transport sensor histidine kinase DctB